eukprot:5733017-Prymnesium_polylepis.2
MTVCRRCRAAQTGGSAARSRWGAPAGRAAQTRQRGVPRPQGPAAHQLRAGSSAALRKRAPRARQTPLGTRRDHSRARRGAAARQPRTCSRAAGCRQAIFHPRPRRAAAAGRPRR